MITRTYKYRLYPTPSQVSTLKAWQAGCHQVQFLCVLQRRLAWKALRPGGTLPNLATQGREVTQLRREYPELQVVPAEVLGTVVRRVDRAYAKMREDQKAGKKAKVRWRRYPHEVGLEFRGQPKSGTKMVRRTTRHGWWLLSNTHQRLGELKVRMHRSIPDNAERLRVHITQEADGWYISFACNIHPENTEPTNAVVGVDLGCIHQGDLQRVCATSDGQVFEIPDKLKQSQRRLATLQKLVSNKRSTHVNAQPANMDSNRTKKRRERIARLHQTIARQRRHHMEYISSRLVDKYNVVVFENIDWKGLRAKGGSHKTGLNRSLSSAAPGLLIRLVEEKAEKHGRLVLKVPAHNTSQACSACGTVGEKKDLSIRAWQCKACGETHDRDVNAALNIAARGRLMIEA